MKKSFFFIVIILTFSTISKGSNDSIVTANKLWSYVGCVYHPDFIPCRYSFYTRFELDTIINEIKYHKVFSSQDPSMESWELDGFIREEDNRVFRILKGESFEGLLYDFNVSVGDTVYVNPITGSLAAKMLVLECDTINTLSKKRKRLRLLNNISELEEYWIEGLGSSFGIMNSGNYTREWHLLCFWFEEILEYSNPDFEECFIANPYALKENELYKGKVQLYPNPGSKTLYLELDVSFPSQELVFKLFSIDGQQVLSAQTFGNESFDVSQLPNGIYLYSLATSSRKILSSGKLILQ